MDFSTLLVLLAAEDNSVCSLLKMVVKLAVVLFAVVFAVFSEITVIPWVADRDGP